MLEPAEVDEEECRKVAARKREVWEAAVNQVHHHDINVQTLLRLKLSWVFVQYAKEHHAHFPVPDSMYLCMSKEDD